MSNILFYCLSKSYCSHAPFAKCPFRAFGNSSPSFMVLARRKKYNRWHTHTTARQILPTGTFFMQINPIAITTVTVPTILHFVPIVMALFWTKLSRCFLYKFVPMNQSCSSVLHGKAEQRCHVKRNSWQDRKYNSYRTKSQTKKSKHDPDYF